MINSRQNRWVKDIRRIRRSKGSRILLEGPHLLREALTVGIRFEVVLATEELLASELGGDLSSRLDRPPLLIDHRLLDEICDSDSPRGIVAIGDHPMATLGTLPKVEGGLYIYADGLQDPGNLGALARVAEAASATALITGPGSCHLGHPRALRASAGSLLRLPCAAGIEISALNDRLAILQPTWATLAPRGGHSIYDVTWNDTMILAVGAEGPGVSALLRRQTDLRLTIPMGGNVESLNATVSAAVVLFERARWLRRVGRDVGGDVGAPTER